MEKRRNGVETVITWNERGLIALCPLELEADMNKSLQSIEKLAAHGFAITNAEKQKQITSKVFSAINLLSHSPHERIAIFLSLANVICPIQASIVLECNS